MASRASEARRHCVGIYPQQCMFNHARESFHVSSNESDFVIYHIIADQSNWALLKLHTKTEVACMWCHDYCAHVVSRTWCGPCMDFLGDVIHSRYIA